MSLTDAWKKVQPALDQFEEAIKRNQALREAETDQESSRPNLAIDGTLGEVHSLGDRGTYRKASNRGSPSRRFVSNTIGSFTVSILHLLCLAAPATVLSTCQ